MPKKTMAVTVIIETDHPLLSGDEPDLSTVAKTQALRQAVIDELPHLTRVVSVMPEELCRLMQMAHAHAMAESGAAKLFKRPPADYRAPGDPRPPWTPGKADGS